MAKDDLEYCKGCGLPNETPRKKCSHCGYCEVCL